MQNIRDDRLYHVTANWMTGDKRHLCRDFIICATNKEDAGKMAQNHIPKLNEEDIISNLKVRIRDFGPTQKNRTYFTSQIQPTKQTDIDTPSVLDETAGHFAYLWGFELGSLQQSEHLSSDQKIQMQIMSEQTAKELLFYQWATEYLRDRRENRHQFFFDKLQALTKIVHQDMTNHSSEEPVAFDITVLEAIQSQAKQQADDLLAQARKQADEIVANAKQQASDILTQAETIKQQREDSFQEKLQLYEHMMSQATIQTKSIQQLFAAILNEHYHVQSFLQEFTNPEVIYQTAQHAITNMNKLPIVNDDEPKSKAEISASTEEPTENIPDEKSDVETIPEDIISTPTDVLEDNNTPEITDIDFSETTELSNDKTKSETDVKSPDETTKSDRSFTTPEPETMNDTPDTTETKQPDVNPTDYIDTATNDFESWWTAHYVDNPNTNPHRYEEISFLRMALVSDNGYWTNEFLRTTVSADDMPKALIDCKKDGFQPDKISDDSYLEQIVAIMWRSYDETQKTALELLIDKYITSPPPATGTMDENEEQLPMDMYEPEEYDPSEEEPEFDIEIEPDI